MDIQGQFEVNGLPRDGATVKLWSSGAFTTRPVKDTAIPSGSPITSGTTGPSAGGNGQYRFTSVASGEYYASIEWNGSIIYNYHEVQDAVNGLGYTLASNYANLQLAINATASGGTLFIPAGIYTIDASATYAWTHVEEGSKHGLVCYDKPINICGAGQATKLRAGANNVAILTLLSTSGATSQRTSYVSVEHLNVDNPNSYTGVSGIVCDRARRNRFRDLTVGDANHTSGCHVGMQFKAAFIQDIENCYFNRNDYAIDTWDYPALAGNGGPSHGLFIRGGEFINNAVAIRLHDVHECAIYATVIEGNTSGCIFVGCEQISMYGIYWEQSGTNWDVITSGACRALYFDNLDKISMTDTYVVTIRDMPESANRRISADSTVGNIVLINPWYAVSVDNTDSRSDICTLYDAGQLTFLNHAQNLTSWVMPRDDVGTNLLVNSEMGNSAEGWTLSNMVANSSGSAAPPPGFYNWVETNSVVAATVGTVDRLINLTFPTDFRSQTVTLSAWIRVPDGTWNAQFQILDGGASPLRTVPDARLNASWHKVSAVFPISSTATSLRVRFRFTVGSSASGVAYCTGLTATRGMVALAPEMPGWRMPAIQTARPLKPANGLALQTNTTLDPTQCSIYVVSGSGGAITGTTGSPLFSASGQWQDGMEVELYGSSIANTYTIASGDPATTKLKVGAATRTLSKGSAITFRYVSANGWWSENGFSA